MGKIYMRAGISPMDNFHPAYALLRNSIGSNVGNLIYAYSMFRTLTTEENSVIPNYYRVDPYDADRINEKYDCFVIPLADAFRENFIPELRKMTTMIERLKIPCIVTGVGVRAPFEPGEELRFPFDEDIRAFVKAVLDKSAMVGVRGEITAAYLSRLGFKEGRDHMAIGCPSMYTFGRNLNIRKVRLTPQSRISVNASAIAPNHVHEFLYRTMQAIPDHFFLPQLLAELRLLYTGRPYVPKSGCSPYPCRITDDVYRKDRVRFFLRATEWIDFLKQIDLSVGSRMHGNITAILAGTPSILIPHDARMRELVDYHALTHIPAKEITPETDIFSLVSSLDLEKPVRVHGRNFDRFISFLDKNGLNHIYKDGKDPDKVPLDLQMEGKVRKASVDSIRSCTMGDRCQRKVYIRMEKFLKKIHRHLFKKFK